MARWDTANTHRYSCFGSSRTPIAHLDGFHRVARELCHFFVLPKSKHVLESLFGNPGGIRDHTCQTRDHTCYFVVKKTKGAAITVKITSRESTLCEPLGAKLRSLSIDFDT